MTDVLDKLRIAEELGKPVRAIIETALDCRMFDDNDNHIYDARGIEILLHGNSQEDVERNLSLAILGAAGGKSILWKDAPEMADNTQKLSDFQRECGMVLWSGYARFHLAIAP